ncbi:MAG: Imm63 family immunity protein [Janthinobacterium lividum]
MTLTAVETVIRALGQQLGAPAALLPTFGCNEDYARPEVRVDGAGYHFVVVERGRELDHRVFQQLEELLFTVFAGVTFAMASHYELHHRVAGQDSRILLFARQLELLAQLDADFANRLRPRYRQLLADA